MTVYSRSLILNSFFAAPVKGGEWYMWCVYQIWEKEHMQKEMGMRKHSLLRTAFWRYDSCGLYFTHLNSTILQFLLYSQSCASITTIDLLEYFITPQDFSGGSMVKNWPANAGDAGLIPGPGRSPGEGNGNPLQYSFLGNPMERGACQATIHGITKESDMAQ